jgi:RNA polymerase sigma-70 factor (ECF subfamily)
MAQIQRPDKLGRIPIPGHDKKGYGNRQTVACLAGFPKQQADVFVLSRIEGLTYQKIAEIMDCSQGTVRVHLHRALNRLARELSDYLA